MPSVVLEKLDRALAEIDRPGTFCSSGKMPAVLPGLEVEGLGPIGLPLTPGTAKDLIKHCHQAPYGKGEQTLVDTQVRRVWRLEPDHFALKNPDWDRLVKEIVGRVQEELGLASQKLESQLHDLLLYERGSFFLPHRDGEKLARMVATLVMVLPSSFEGGELVVRHEGQERTFDFGGPAGDPFHIHYAAFYADCEHEIRPLAKGYRLCLVYNLTLAKSKKSLAAPRASEHIEKIAPIIQKWASDESSEKLGIVLDHQYTEGGLSWDALKGTDRAKACVLAEAAGRVGCRAYLTLLTLHESGSAEYAGSRSGRGYGYGRRRSGYGDYGDDGDADDYEMGEIYETSLSANHWSDVEGNRLPIGELTVREDDLLDPEAIRLGDPETEFEGFTGNAGMTLDHWYRHAAIFLWPERRHFAVICERDSRALVPELGRMVARWKASRGARAAALEAQCRELAAAIVEKWPKDAYGPLKPEVDDHWTGGLLESLAALEETRLIGDFMREALIMDSAAEPGKSIAAIGQKLGWATFQPQLAAVMKRTTRGTMARNVRLLESICTTKPRKKAEWAELCAMLATELVAAIESIDRAPAASVDWRYRSVDRAEVLAGLARSLIAAEQNKLMSRLIDHALDTPAVYSLTEVHIKALASLRTWMTRKVKHASPALTRWLDSVRKQLEARTATAPKEPADFRRPASIKCGCADCTALKRFLEDPRERVLRLKAGKDRRKHLHSQIDSNRLDLTHVTERIGSPQTLVCTKTTASYQASLRKYHEDRQDLETIKGIRANLPG